MVNKNKTAALWVGFGLAGWTDSTSCMKVNNCTNGADTNKFVVLFSH